MQEQTGEIKELTEQEHKTLMKEEQERVQKTLQGFTALTEDEFKAMKNTIIDERPSDLSLMRYLENMDVRDLSNATIDEIFTDGFKLARRIYEENIKEVTTK